MPNSFTHLGICLALAATVYGQDDPPKVPYKDALRQYKKLVRKKPLSKRLEARILLAQSRDPRALEILIASYGKPEAPKDQVRHLLVSIVTRHFGIAKNHAALTEWRSEYEESADAWLWYRTLCPPFMSKHMNLMLKAAETQDDPFVRAAALRSLASMVDGTKDQHLPIAKSLKKILANLPKDPVEKSLLLEACASVVHGHRLVIRHKIKPWKPITKTLIQSLADRRLPHRSKLALSRYFALTFKVPDLGTKPRPWLDWLEGKPLSEPSVSKARPGFFGIPALGKRICYVIDASDSMLEPVDEDARPRLNAIATAGSGEDKGAALPWDRIQTRFDLAREFLARALHSLDKNTRFSVILYGDKARPLAAAAKLVPASASNVSKVLAELSAIAEKRKPRKPDPTLFGATNLHAGILQAFGTTRSRPIRRGRYVSRKLLANGCDTMYLLSDGEPDRDSLDEPGLGPFARAPHDLLIEDVQRLNLFRKVQIHCISLGEAKPTPLSQIAILGLGTHVSITNQKRP